LKLLRLLRESIQCSQLTRSFVFQRVVWMHVILRPIRGAWSAIHLQARMAVKEQDGRELLSVMG
jgi:hypothetical protein